MSRADDWRRRLVVIHDTNPPRANDNPARPVGHCCRSGFCCWAAPCELTHDDLERLAARFSLSPAAFFVAYVQVVPGYYPETVHLQLRRAQHAGGAWKTAAQSWDIDTPCVFLSQTLGEQATCTVHEDKPQVGAEHGCWKADEERAAAFRRRRDAITWSPAEVIALGWDGARDDGGSVREDE